MPLPELPRAAVDPAMPLPVSDSTLPATPMPSASHLSSPAAPLPAPAAASPATTPPVPALDVNTIVFLQQQLERVVSFMRTVDARLDSLERTTLHLVSQQERLNKQLELRQQRPANTSLSSSGTGIGGAGSMGGAMVETGGICPLCGLHFADSNELQLHVQTCLDKRESRDRRSSSTGGSSGNQGGKDSGIFGRLLGKH